jgi:hydroxymethylglutaryl-CoA lyase
MAKHSASPARDIILSEVGPRDGLQSIARIMPTAAKNAWIKALAAAGPCVQD